jgi:hypothetical protein
MVTARRAGYPQAMSTSTVSTPTRRPLTLIAAVLLAGFGAFSIWVVASFGYLGFIASARRDWWTLQILIDLVISMSFAIGWMAADARRRGIKSWPYAVAALFTGSLAVLVYYVMRPAAPVARS